MPKRDIDLYLQNIKTAIRKIKSYTRGMSFDDFRHDDKTIDSVVRNIEIIGEAANNIPIKIRAKYSKVPWQKMIAMRNKVIHEYFGVDEEILWATIKGDILELSKEINKINLNLGKKK